MKHRIQVCLTIIVVALLLGLGNYFVKTEVYTLTLTVNGFSPAIMTVSEGDTVRFVTVNDEPFWPASNLHPEHTAYPDFDPKKPIAPNDSWEFTFSESGTYKFHDHINSLYEGVIIVMSTKGETSAIDCTEAQNPQCWEELILETLENEGVAASFEKLIDLSETEPLFGNDCHGYSHLIGEEAYNLYVAEENFELTPATTMCGYGFYHGFMETLLQTTGDIQEARDFCISADQKLEGQGGGASQACYHGTGHGAVDGGDPTAWGDIDAMMQPGFDMCDRLVETDLQSYLCDTGVFNAIEILSYDQKYEISDLHDDPFELCNEQPLERREACYSNMIPLLFNNFDNNFERIFEYVNKNMIDGTEPAIDGNNINGLVTLGVMFEFIRLHGTELDYMKRAVVLCREQPAEDQLSCIQGVSGGHIKYGKPGIGYVKNLEFCSFQLLTEPERDACYKYLLPRVRSTYGEQKAVEICAVVPVEYKKRYCYQ
jgi:plastocyanin